jgi:putative SOS response-associated peptidase YedK
MCGRYTVSSAEEVAEAFDVESYPSFGARYNVSPGQVVAVVGHKADGLRRGLALLRWGLVPSWANDPKSGPKPINARSETVLDKPTFRDSFKEKRCLIPSSGFYEWLKAGRVKRPHHIRLKGGGLFAFAGLWDVWKGDEEQVATCCILTTTANELVRPLHDRMPVILTPDQYDPWLRNDTPVDQLQAMLQPYPADQMEVVEVVPLVNKVANDSPELLTPAA